MSESDGTGISRRDVLQKGAATGAMLAVGGTAMTGAAAAQYDPCNVRIKGVKDCGGKTNENAQKQSGQSATAYVSNCSGAEDKTFQVNEEVEGDGLCPDPNGNTEVHCYDVRFCPGDAIRTVCVKGTLPEDSYWQITETEECDDS